MIAVDTNVLVYAHREDSPWHEPAYARLSELAEAPAAWAIPWPCLYKFLAVVTHPRIYNPPAPLKKVLDQVDAWLEAPSLVLFAENRTHWPELRATLSDSRVAGPQVHDARIAALCHANGIGELWTADRDFNRFPKLKSFNPLVEWANPGLR